MAGRAGAAKAVASKRRTKHLREIAPTGTDVDTAVAHAKENTSYRQLMMRSCGLSLDRAALLARAEQCLAWRSSGNFRGAEEYFSDLHSAWAAVQRKNRAEIARLAKLTITDLADAVLDLVYVNEAMAAPYDDGEMRGETEALRAWKDDRREKDRTRTKPATEESVSSRERRWGKWRALVAAKAASIRETRPNCTDSGLAVMIHAWLPRQLPGAPSQVDDSKPKKRTIRRWLAQGRSPR